MKISPAQDRDPSAYPSASGSLGPPAADMWGIANQCAAKIALYGLSKSPVSFRSSFLRDACMSPAAVDVSTRQKVFSTPSVLSTTVETAKVEDNHLKIKWSDGHYSEFSKSWLQRYSSLSSSLAYRGQPQQWTPWTNDLKLHRLEFNDCLAKNSEFEKAMLSLGEYGIIQVTGIPGGECGHHEGTPTVEVLASLIGNYPKTTFYGTSWDVKSIQQARNVAYTSVFLPLHMDLLYYESPPGIQLLHVINNSVTGGESYFADAYAAALHIQKTDPEAYQALCTVPLSYHYVNDGQHYFQMRPVISLNPYSGAIDHLNYSPPFQGPIDALNDLEDATFDAFSRGLAAFEAFVENKDNQVQFRMDPGTCIVFYNRRALHARREFDASSGDRWFKGTYTDIDAFNSTVRMVRESAETET